MQLADREKFGRRTIDVVDESAGCGDGFDCFLYEAFGQQHVIWNASTCPEVLEIDRIECIVIVYVPYAGPLSVVQAVREIFLEEGALDDTPPFAGVGRYRLP